MWRAQEIEREALEPLEGQPSQCNLHVPPERLVIRLPSAKQTGSTPTRAREQML
jgi:hypothetical protein